MVDVAGRTITDAGTVLVKREDKQIGNRCEIVGIGKCMGNFSIYIALFRIAVERNCEYLVRFEPEGRNRLGAVEIETRSVEV